MYNYQTIIDLLNERNLKHSDLTKYLGLTEKANLIQQINKDIRVSKLEKIAEFFGVPTDTFFNKPTTGNNVGFSGQHQRFRDVHIQQDSQCKSLMALIDEKDKRIALLEEMVNLLKSKSSGSDGISGQNQDNNQ